jgi:hypothetical protein
MSAKVIWKIDGLVVAPNNGAHADVVTRCSWSCTASEDGKSSTIEGSKHFDSAGDPFVAFDSLTEADVLNWVWNAGLNKEAVEGNAVAALHALSAPVAVNKPLPWVKAE